jgi:hypothetical protein
MSDNTTNRRKDIIPSYSANNKRKRDYDNFNMSSSSSSSSSSNSNINININNSNSNSNDEEEEEEDYDSSDDEAVERRMHSKRATAAGMKKEKEKEKEKKNMKKKKIMGPNNDRWDKHFQDLLEYKKKNNGKTNVPQEYYPNPELGTWVNKQRVAYKDNDLLKDRIIKLESIGFRWRIYIMIPWIDMYARLQKYKNKYGTTDVPRQYPVDPQLGFWVTNQRNICKKQDKIDLLNNIGFVWSVGGSRTGTKNKITKKKKKNCKTISKLSQVLKSK